MLRQLIFITAVFAAWQAQAADAGKIIFVAGAAKVAGQDAALGASVQEGQLLHTGADGYVYIQTIDDGLFILRPNTEARIASYHVDSANPANTRIKLELLSGVARSQSGHAVKLARQNFRFNTPVAAIGVRGTDFTVFTDSDTSRVAVLSGAVTVSGFEGACRPEGSGPCEGGSGHELSAAQRGLLLQIRRGQAVPQLMQGSALSPDVQAPPRPDEPGRNGGGTALNSSDPNLDAKKNSNFQSQVPAIAPVIAPPPVDIVTPPPELAPPLVGQNAAPPQAVTWGRWATLANVAPTSGLSKDDAYLLASNETYALFLSKSGTPYSLPVRGSAAFVMTGSEAYVRDSDTQVKTLATLQNGQLAVDFGKASYTTSFDVLDQGNRYKMGASGSVRSDGIFMSYNQYALPNNMQINGALSGDGTATYLFQGNLTERRVISGVTVWGK